MLKFFGFLVVVVVVVDCFYIVLFSAVQQTVPSFACDFLETFFNDLFCAITREYHLHCPTSAHVIILYGGT